MIATFFTQTLTVRRTTSTSRDEIGAEVIDSETDVEVLGYIEPVSGEEDRVNRNTQLGDWWAFVPAGTDVTGWDRLVYDGRTFDIVAPPEPFTHPTLSALNHIRLRLQEVT